ncbi:MAG: DegT/DnrJ/EryC1/StrS family aminotransferase [Acidobacteriota bacterium]
MRTIPHSRPLLGTEEQRALRQVLASGLLSQGTEVLAFEHAMASALGRRHAAAVSSGTAALHLALLTLGVGRGDRVALPSYACAALVHAASLTGAEPLLVDVDPATFNLDPDDLRRRLRRRTKAVIVPHMFGLPAPFEEIRALGVPVIEDCALALGSRYRGKPTGSLGVLSVASFYATKMITTGEGGMVLGNQSGLLRKVKDLRSYDGRSRHRNRFNYKMTDLQAALGKVQLDRLTAFVQRRRRLAAFYLEALREGPWELPSEQEEHAFYRFVIRTHRYPTDRFLRRLQKRGIEARRPVFKPLHRYLGLRGFPGADEAFRRAVSLPLYPALRRWEAERVARATRSVGRALNR